MAADHGRSSPPLKNAETRKTLKAYACLSCSGEQSISLGPCCAPRGA
eukprot:CAMPEP_0185434364 /NCGR_PEP_ID=MMETSP1365-20130426/23860_1 /TAXON_ID=38817 /ORGANISM="Gephyrocapsa oceanica, Strain RCC1303" /LENGTH=46 /DNA_ID= /DNA_START= /DNA_END= /DNA_ORIENTATION=